MNCTCMCGNCLNKIRVIIREEISQLSSVVAESSGSVVAINKAVKYIDVREYCVAMNLSRRKVYHDLKSNKIPGAQQLGKLWRIPVAS